MKKIFLFILCLMPLLLFGQSQNVRHIITPDGEITFWRGQQQLFVRAYTGEPIYEADYYVATNGNNSNDGLTIATPWRTLSYAETQLVAGDVLMVRGGVYNEDVLFYGQHGTAENPIVIMAYPGEIPIIDGSGLESGTALVDIRFDYTHFSGFEVRNVEEGTGIVLSGLYNKVINCVVHDCIGSGIGIGGDGTADGDYAIVEYCTVYNTAMSNEEGILPISWGTGISARRSPDNVTIRHCVVHDVWGEGISTFEATNTTIEDNIVYNCFSVGIYVSDATDCLVQRNLVYTTKIMTNGSQVGIGTWQETHIPENARNTFINNIVYGCRRNFCMLSAPHDDIFISNNTFVNSTHIASVHFSGEAEDYTNVEFTNNIVVQDGALPVIYMEYASTQDILFSYNNWSKTPNVYAQGTGDVIGDPLFTKTGSILPGILTGHYFDLQALSPAIDAADDIDLADDYFGNVRGDDPDMGAIEAEEGGSTLLSVLTAYWKLDESSGDAIDETGNGHTGSVSGATQGSAGKINTAYLFDGINDYISLIQITSGTSFTIAMWVKRDETQTDDYGTLFTDAAGNNGLWLGKTGYLNYYYSSTNHLSSSTIANATLTLIAISVSSGTGTFYINDSPTGTVNSIPSCNLSRIGYTGVEPYKGVMDEIGFWGRALTSDEITELYNLGSGKTHPF